jgi:hypothetical protein
MRLFLAAALLCLGATSAWAQGAVQQSGPVTPGHLPVWVQDHVIGDYAGSLTFNITGMPAVATNAALQALSTTSATVAFRTGFYAPGDGGAMAYYYSTSACSLNSGGGDNGSQVKPNTGGGCWEWLPPAAGVTPLVFGAYGNSTTDDTAPVQSSVNAVSTAGIPLLFNSKYLYLTTGTLTVAAPLNIQGPYRYGIWVANQPTGNGMQGCDFGILNTSNATVLRITAVTATVRGLCIQLSNSNSTQATGGAAIQLAPSSTTTFQAGVTLEYNTIIRPYNGITVDGAGVNTGCCGAGTTADGNVINRNTIINPAHIGISNGANTNNAQTVGTTVNDNAIVCGSAGTIRGIGIAIFDGAIAYDGTQNGPLGCTIGIELVPGANQYASFVGRGALGDQSVTHDFLLAPSAASAKVAFVQCDSCWASATSSYNETSISLDASAGGAIEEITFNNLVAHGGNGQTLPIISIVDGGVGAVYSFSLVNSTLCGFASSGAPTIPAGLQMTISNANSGEFIISNNRIGMGCDGSTFITGIKILQSGGASGTGKLNGVVTGNNFSLLERLSEVPIYYIPANEDMVINNNIGIDDYVGTQSGATLTPNVSTTRFTVTGPTTVSNIMTAGGALTTAWYQNGTVHIYPVTGAVTFATGGNLCTGGTGNVGTDVTATWNVTANCWRMHF